MLKELLDFIKTGLALVLFYAVYLVSAFVMTILLGLPIYLGIQYIDDVIAAIIQ